jgi:endonuclease YncB( thermonuclease family)
VAKFLIPLILFILLISLTVNFFFIRQKIENNRVVKVFDGDTFDLKSGERVRLMGLDAPEMGRCGSVQAKERLASLVLGKTVNLEETAREEYGRTLALVYQNGKLINNIMIEEGWAVADYRKNSQKDILAQSHKDAQVKKVGLWSFCINPKSDCTIKANIDLTRTNQKFYHLPSCQHYNEVVLNTAYGEQWFCTEDEAIKAGFIKAAGCH